MSKKPSVEKGKKRVRIVMKQKDRDTLRHNLVFTFKTCGASEEQAMAAVTTGSLPMEVWIQRWICHHTNYQTAGLTEQNFRKGCFAWIYYKATVEVAEYLEISDETLEKQNEMILKKASELEPENGKEEDGQ